MKLNIPRVWPRLLTILIAIIFLLNLVFLPNFAEATKPHTNNLDTVQSGSGSDTDALRAAEVPARDRVSLAQRFFGLGEVSPPPSESANNYSIGDVETFSVQHFTDGLFEIEAELLYFNDVLYMWVEVGQDVNIERVRSSADTFAEEIYQPIRTIFGEESSPGIDGDTRLHVLHSTNIGGSIAAYFSSESAYPASAVPSSNEREMFFVNLDNMRRQIGSNYYNSVLAHEFQHMVHSAVDDNEESWLNEGLSELATFTTGFELSGFANSYIQNTNFQLTYWPTAQRSIIYGGAFLFTAYMLDRFGTEAIRTLVASPANGMESVQQSLDTLGLLDPIDNQPMTSERLFMDFSVANLLQDLSVANGQFGYLDPRFDALSAIDNTRTFFDPADVVIENRELSQWSTQYIGLEPSSGQGTYTLSFDGNETVGIVPADPYSGSFAFWSNRFDASDTRLTRAFDLSEVESATLNFWTWYDIEDDWDYAYVAVSSDGGSTWDTLETPRTTISDPHGNSYGNGYTGATNDWVQESIDISDYAGQEILIRFEYITDDATIENGFLLDDVSIPEIDYFEDFETIDDSWTVEGWVRIQNSLNQSFSLQLVEIGEDETTVTRLLTNEPASDESWEIVVTDKEIVLVVSAFAPNTTETATYTLTLTPTE